MIPVHFSVISRIHNHSTHLCVLFYFKPFLYKYLKKINVFLKSIFLKILYCLFLLICSFFKFCLVLLIGGFFKVSIMSFYYVV